MRLAVVSDVHSSLYALEAALAALEREGYDRLVNLGDSVGYGAFPNETLDALWERQQTAVSGNHDAAMGDPAVSDGFNRYARKAAAWSRGQLTEENRQRLGALGKTALCEGVLLCHDSPDRPGTWEYVRMGARVRSAFGAEFELCLYGHTHVPAVHSYDGDAFCSLYPTGEVGLDGSARYLLNPGSVGQPRDGDPRASALILDTKQRVCRFIRVEYDVEAAAREIRDAGLPVQLAKRLFAGV